MRSQHSSLKLDTVSRFIGAIILTVGMTLTLALVYYVHSKNSLEDKLRLEYESNLIIRRVQSWMDRYDGALIQTRAFILNAAPITREKFKDYVYDTEIFKRYPGLQGIGYTALLEASEIDKHLQEIRKEIPNYTLWPEGEREKYSAIITLEPSTQMNLRAIGYDMYSDPIRRRAMDSAIQENAAIRTTKIILVQEDEGKNLPGFNLYLPLFKKNADLTTVENRLNNIVGFIYSPFRTGELFKAIFKDVKMYLDVKIYDGDEISEEKIIYNFDQRDNHASDLKYVLKMNLNGLPMTFVFTPLPNFIRVDTIYKLIGAFLLGSILTFSVFGYYNSTKRRLLLARIRSIEKNEQLAKEKLHVEVRDDFLSIASHELKTPLTSLKLHAQLMLRQLAKDNSEVVPKERVLALINLINNQTFRIIRLVDDMLDISRIRTGNLKIEKADIELQSVIADVVERLESQFIEKTGKRPVIHCEEKVTGYWDQFRIEQVINNLLTNALRYGNNKPVEVKCVKDQSYVRIEVIDHGIGIAAKDLERIFNRFQRAEMTDNEVNGLGLGLYITNQIVLAHNGRIEVQSEPGKGSTFSVILPFA